MVILNAAVHGGFQLPYTAATATFVQAVRVQDADDVVLGDTTGRSTNMEDDVDVEKIIRVQDVAVARA